MRRIFIILFTFSIISCKNKGNNSNQIEKLSVITAESNSVDFYKKQLQNALLQTNFMLTVAEKENRIPRTVTENNQIHWIQDEFDWTEGFFPGTLWYLYEFSKDEKFMKAADKFQSSFETHKSLTENHDLGFIFNSSYGNGFRLLNEKNYKDVLITASNSLITRFNEKVGCIKSWNVDKGWQSKRNWQFPVIIDNMMNLELLFKATELTGDEKYKNVAISHANTTLKNHFRKDNSSYHVVDYDPITGNVRSQQTAQGYADDSSWARGQAWAVYGYTVCYRYTKDEKYLKHAENVADFIINYKGLPDDGIPYWDYNASNIPNEPRDVSAATVTISALLELDTYSSKEYSSYIDKVFSSLASEKYTAKLGENNNFILKHSVGSIPHNNEIDVPLNYADYYYVEALLRKIKN